MPPKSPFLRLSVLAAALAWMGDAAALGLGELRTRSFLGERFVAQVEVLSAGSEIVDASCFRLRAPPQGESELPWLRQASFTFHKGPPAVLEIRSSATLREPVIQVGLAVGCGHEVRRDYTLFISPRNGEVETPPFVAPPSVPAPGQRRAARPALDDAPPPLPRPLPRRSDRAPEKRAKPLLLPDRLVLSGGGEVGDPTLRLATELQSWSEGGGAGREAQRELLRLEFRMLMAMQEQANSQLAAAEKLRNMEGTLADLQQRATEFTNRIEKGVGGNSQPVAASAPVPETAPIAPPPEKAPAQVTSLLTEWSFYGVLLGAMLGIGGWVGWRQFRQRREAVLVADQGFALEPVMDPVREEEEGRSRSSEVDLHVEPPVAGTAAQVDVPLDLDDVPVLPRAAVIPPAPAGGGLESDFSVSGATVDEHFEANPVMELAEIMLSFGRVKGAAQALQEYIDHNPEEALQPWIRLMDVYRMAGMREEFERLAQDLNRHFNVEVQQWDPSQPAVPRLDMPLDFGSGQPVAPATPPAPKAYTLEDVPHIRKKLVESWGTPECSEYLHQLLRDNRGGKRSGFTLPVVEEILFLIELQETKTLMDKDGEKK